MGFQHRFDYLVVAGGKPPGTALLRKFARVANHIVTVDKGADAAFKAGLRPYLHIGDDDSISKSALKQIPRSIRKKLPRQKAISDLEFALRSLPREANKIVTGAHRDDQGRMDHVFVNFMIALRDPNLILADDGMWIIGLRRGVFAFEAPKGTLFSVIGTGRDRITIKGSRYDVKNESLVIPSLGLSNQVSEKSVKITTRGPALLFVAQNLLKCSLS